VFRGILNLSQGALHLSSYLEDKAGEKPDDDELEAPKNEGIERRNK
jgi:hypothetical protein